MSAEKGIIDELKIKFEKLTPNADINESETKGYKEALDFSLLEGDITNVAITGAYGSGKSSVIESYKKTTEKKFIHISLSHFSNEEIENQNDKNINDRVNLKFLLEGKILNQLLHQIKPGNIPQTIFRIKNNVTKHKIIRETLLIFIAILSIIILFEIPHLFSPIEKIGSWILGIFPMIGRISKDIIALLLLAFVSIYMLYNIIFTQLNRKIFKGFTFKNSGIESDIEIFSDSSESYFNKYLDDVIYLFCESGADVIVFEDIDRFDNGEIFENIREINTLVNNKIKRGKFKSEKITFLYLIKDDMFVSKERTKFFDLIIPIVPIITNSNSYEKLLELFEKDGKMMSFNRNFLQKLSLYIDDMRLMKNIYNEYAIYSTRINIKEMNLKNEQLLAILTYKNIFPKDFSDLLVNKGFMDSIFRNKDNFMEEIKESIEEKIYRIEEKIDSSENEILNSINELEYLYLRYKYVLRVGNMSINDCTSGSDFISELKKNEHASYNKYSYEKSISWKEINGGGNKSVAYIDKSKEFSERLQSIEDKDNIIRLQEEKENLREQLKKLKQKKIRDLVTKVKFEELSFNYDSVKNNEYINLLYFLTRNGYIEEGYQDYTTYFYANSLRLCDKKFLRSITDESPLSWKYELTDKDSIKDEIIDRMSISDFSNIASLNYQLLEYMLLKSKHTEVDEFLGTQINMMGNEKQVEFILNAFISYPDFSKKQLILKCAEHNSKVFNDIISDEKYSSRDVSEFVMYLLSVLDVDVVSRIENEDNILLRFINKTFSFLELVDDTVSNRFYNNMLTVSPKFKKIKLNSVSSKLPQFIFDHNLYDINPDNIKEVLRYFYNFEDEDKIKHQNYTVLSELGDDKLLNYVQNDDDFEVYVRQYLELSESTILDKAEYSYKVINSEVLTDEIKVDYIKAITKSEMQLDKVDNKAMKQVLVTNGKVEVNTKNIVGYYLVKDESWTDELIELVNSSTEINFFNGNKAKEYLNTKELKFIENTIKCSNLNSEVYKQILSSMQNTIIEFDFENINDEKMQILIACNKIGFSITSIETFRDVYPSHLDSFIVNNYAEYIIYISENKVDDDELLNLLEISSSLTLEQQKKIAGFVERKVISIRERNLNDDIKLYVIEKYFDVADLKYLCENYGEFSEALQWEIIEKASDNIDKIDGEFFIQKKLLLKLVEENRVLKDDRIELFSYHIEKLTVEETRVVFEDFGLHDFLDTFNQKNPSFEITDVNKRMLEYLHNKKVFSSFRVQNSKYKVFNYRKKKAIGHN